MIDMILATNFRAAIVALPPLIFVLALYIIWAMTTFGLHFEGAATVRFGAFTGAPFVEILVFPSLHLHPGVLPNLWAILGISFASALLALWLRVLDPLLAIQLFIVFFAVVTPIFKQLFSVRQAISALALLALLFQPLSRLVAAPKELCAFGFKGVAFSASPIAVWQRYIMERRIVPARLALFRKAIDIAAILVEVVGAARHYFGAFTALLFGHSNPLLNCCL